MIPATRPTTDPREIFRARHGDEELERKYGWINDRHINSNLVWHKHEVVIMLIPKAAASSISRATNCLSRTLDVEWRSKRYVLEHCEGYFKAAFVRDPMSRLLSCWRDKVIKRLHRTFHLFDIEFGITFPEFISIIADVPDELADKHFRAQAHDLLDAGRLIPEYVGRVETMAHDWALFAAHVEARHGMTVEHAIGHHNRTARGDSVMPVDDETRRLIHERWAPDFEWFGKDSALSIR